MRLNELLRLTSLCPDLELIEANNVVATFNTPSLGDRILELVLTKKAVRLGVRYIGTSYDKTLQSRMDAIKTARDICDFYDDVKSHNYIDIAPVTRYHDLPDMSLVYFNRSSANMVIVNSCTCIDEDDFIGVHADIIEKLNKDLDSLTELIKIDHAGGGDVLRWERPRRVRKDWWNW